MTLDQKINNPWNLAPPDENYFELLHVDLEVREELISRLCEVNQDIERIEDLNENYELSPLADAYLFLAQLSNLSYAPPEKIKEELHKCRFQFTIAEEYDHDLRVVIVRTGSTLILVYRGTASLKNIHLDLQITPTDVYLARGQYIGSVHTGFLRAHQALFDETKKSINELLRRPVSAPIKSVYFTGHSLGGCLAHLDALQRPLLDGETDALLKEHLFEGEKHLVTFGQPRVGSPNFAQFTDDSQYSYCRFVHHGDKVPMFPRNVSMNKRLFAHAGRQISLGPKGRQGPEADYDSLTTEELRDLLKQPSFNTIGFPGKHSISRYYIPAIKDWLSRQRY